MRCAPPANLPTPEERANCAEWLEREVALLPEVHVVVCLGGFAWESALRLRAALGGAPVPRPKPKFGHGVVAEGEPWPLLGCFHPSQQNTFTGKLTPADDGRGAARRRASWPGAREALRRHPALAATWARSSRSSLLARLPIGINALAIVLYLREQTGSFAIAGAVVGDARRRARGSARRCRGGSSTASARAACSLPLAVVHARRARRDRRLRRARRADRRCCSLCGFAAGFAIPPTSSVLRSMWTDLLEPRLHQAAYALDSTMIELIFISGPLLTAAIAAVASPAGALIVSAIAVVAGTAIFTALPPTRHVEPERSEHEAACSARSPRPACARSC